MNIIRLLLIVLAVVVVIRVARRVIESFSQTSAQQGRRTKVIDSEVRNVRGPKYFEARRRILEDVRAARLTLDEAEQQLDKLDE